MLVTFIVTLIANFLSNYFRRKYETKTKFFYEMYPKRLAVYDEVDNVLTEICQYAPKLTKMEKFKANEVIISDLYKLKRLCHKLSIYGSVDTWGIVGELYGQIRDRSLEYLNINITSAGHKVEIADEVALGAYALSVVSVINSGHRAFTDAVRAESGENFVDKEIANFLKKTTKRKAVNKTECQID